MNFFDNSLDLSGIKNELEHVRKGGKEHTCAFCNYKTRDKSNFYKHKKTHDRQVAQSGPVTNTPAKSQSSSVPRPMRMLLQSLGINSKSKHEQSLKQCCQICGNGYNQPIHYRFHCSPLPCGVRIPRVTSASHCVLSARQ